MIVVSMLLVIVGAVTLVIGVFFGNDDNLTLVYVSIASCLLAGLFLVAGILKNRPSRKPVLTSEGGDATWSGATAWPGAGGQAEAERPAAATAVLDRDVEPSAPQVEIVTARPEPEPMADVIAQEPSSVELAEADEDVVVVPKRAAEPLAQRATGTARKSTAKKATAKKASPAKKAAPVKKATPAKAAQAKAAAKKTIAKKTSAAAPSTAKKATAKKTTAKKVTAKKVTPPAAKKTAKKTTR